MSGGKVAHLRAGARDGAIGPARHPPDCQPCRGGKLQIFRCAHGAVGEPPIPEVKSSGDGCRSEELIVTKKHLPRRTFLRGMGAAIALPMLDSMIPAFAAPADKKAPVRLAFAYAPNGMIMEYWTPKQLGGNFEFTRILKPLEPFREDLMVLTGLSHLKGEGVGGDH